MSAESDYDDSMQPAYELYEKWTKGAKGRAMKTPNAQASTPLTDALSTEKHIGRKVFQDTRIWKLSRNLERKLAVAQAQIKLATDFIVNFSGNSLGGGDQPVQFLCSSYALVVNQNKALKAQIEEFERTLAAPAALGGKGGGG